MLISIMFIKKCNGAIFTCGGFSFAKIWCVNSFFFFDSHSRNIDSFDDPNGQAVLLQLCNMISLNNFIKSFFENFTAVSLETQYDLQ